MKGKKFDSGKDRWDLVPLVSVKQIIRVLMFGAQKYEDNNWVKVSDGRRRYYNACMRHITDWQSGEEKDPETGFSHLAHAGACILFLLALPKSAKK